VQENSANQDWCFGAFRPEFIGKECLAVRPYQGEIKNRQKAIEYIDYHG
jgi:hypothetical protein